MKSLILTIPHYRLTFNLKVTKRRKGFRTALVARYLEEIQEVRSGSKISRVVRHALERINLKGILGGNIAFAVLASSVLTGGSTIANIEPETSVLAVDQPPVTTEIVVRYPLDTPVQVNQGFYYLHPGVDLKAPTGEPIYPIMKGIVETVEFSRFAYGNSIVVDHQNGYKSRYAHLSRVYVHSGDEVNTKEAIGLVGSTGRSTGAHLHLEVYQNGRVVNPKTVIPLN